ncbi:MAG: type II toxin-antitoxin system Phd/YefM family antitoxin [Coriobacteriales bacterium]|jgi:antitoxin (DNA-binding transcriptional repressor) of toxin-antitoxin stability system|nr:type II toxin-antitoxin system Phd/YefM family antitoxin [Coriobacteriales bacterium]
MTAMTVGELKANFSEVLTNVQNGEEYQILYGRSKKPVAKIVAIEDEALPRRLGPLEGKASFAIGDDFKFKSLDEFFGLE